MRTVHSMSGPEPNSITTPFTQPMQSRRRSYPGSHHHPHRTHKTTYPGTLEAKLQTKLLSHPIISMFLLSWVDRVVIQTSGSTSPDSSHVGDRIRLDNTMRHNRRREAAPQNDTGMWNGLCGLEYCDGQVRFASSLLPWTRDWYTKHNTVIVGVRSATVLLTCCFIMFFFFFYWF